MSAQQLNQPDFRQEIADALAVRASGPALDVFGAGYGSLRYVQRRPDALPGSDGVLQVHARSTESRRVPQIDDALGSDAEPQHGGIFSCAAVSDHRGGDALGWVAEGQRGLSSSGVPPRPA